MPTLKISEVRDMELPVLQEKIEAKREELFHLRLNWHGNKLEDPNEIKRARKDLARMLTVLRERQLAAELVQEES